MKILYIALALLFTIGVGAVAADTGTIMVMKHICGEEVQSQEDFEALGGFADKVLNCPTVLMPGDEGAPGALTLPPQEYNFIVLGDDNHFQQIDEAEFMQAKICESDIGTDLNEDGTISEETCLDTSHYVYSDVAFGDVAVLEQMAPPETRPGALEFTPVALDGNNDQQSLVEFTGETVVLDTAPDDDMMIMLHIYNFRGEAVEHSDEIDGEARVVIEDLGNDEYRFSCEVPFDATATDWNFGDGTKVIDVEPGFITHQYEHAGEYEVVCVASRSDIAYLGYARLTVGEVETDEHDLFAQLLGANEVPPVETTGVGFADVSIVDDRLLLYGAFEDLLSTPIDVAGTQAHIHEGMIGENGPVVFLLDVELNNDNRSGNISLNTTINETVKVELLNGDYYVNLHTEEFPGGEIRGQIIADAIETEFAQVNVMKHICKEEIQSREDFEALGAFVNKVVACPTTTLEGDETTPGAIAAGHSDFEFDVTGLGTTQNIATAAFVQQAVCETDIGADANGDGNVSAETCLDTSLYAFIVPSETTVEVQETAPEQFRFGALEFTPTALVPNNDEETLVELGAVGSGRIVIDTTVDTDGVTTLHVYNFQNLETNETEDVEANETEVEETTVNLHVKEYYPQGLAYVFVCDAGTDADMYDYSFGDGSQQFGSANADAYHMYGSAGAYNVSCAAHFGDEVFEGMLVIDAADE